MRYSVSNYPNDFPFIRTFEIILEKQMYANPQVR